VGRWAMNDKPEEKKPWCFNMNKLNTTLAIIVGLFAIIGAWYTVDCLNIVYFGDTLYAKDSEFAQFRKLRKLEKKIEEKEDRVEHLKQREKDDLLWLNRVRDQYPDPAQMSPELKEKVIETEAQQKKLAGKIKEIEKKLKEWQDKLEKLELELDNGGK
jgi:DNA repair exonuclease SbcCD ATPase subunit